MLNLLLFVTVTAALRSRLKSVGSDTHYTLQRLPIIGPSNGLSDLRTTDNVLQLTRANATSISSAILQSMRLRNYRASIGSANSTVNIQNVEDGQVFLAPITVGGKTYDVVIDSGSSDPWLVGSGFKCYDPETGDLLDESDCKFGPVYDSSQSSTYTAIPNMNFNVTYADHEVMNGRMAYETMTFGGITIARQEFGIVDHAAWYGDETSSGLVGFAYRALTSAYHGNDPTADQSGTTVPYNPLFTNLYTQTPLPPLFSILLSRSTTGSGLLGLGGIPAGAAFAPYFASTPLIPAMLNTSSGEAVYEFYTVEVSGFALSASRATRFNPFASANALKTPLVANGTQVLVDTGSSLAYLPDDVVADLADLYAPPAAWDEARFAYAVDCGAETPVFGVGIGAKVFFVDGQDLIVRVGETDCITGVQPNLGGLSILGGTWLKNVVAVFDVGAAQMRFAAREYYSLYDAAVEQNA